MPGCSKSSLRGQRIADVSPAARAKWRKKYGLHKRGFRTGRRTARAFTEYLLLWNQIRQVLDTASSTASEAVEAAARVNELLRFVLENLPDRAAAAFWMTMRLGVSDSTLFEEPGVQFVIALEH